MKKYFKIIKNFIVQFKKLKQIDVKIIEDQKRNLNLRIKNKSDINRWKNNNELLKNWDERTAILGCFINPNADILEFGAGNMFLKKFLTNYKSYSSSDIIKRYEETIVCDLNLPITIDMSKYNVVVFSGVLEYVYDIGEVFRQLPKNINQVLISYACKDKVNLSREMNGWLSDYNKDELELIFKNNDFKILNYNEWRKQSLYNLIRNL